MLFDLHICFIVVLRYFYYTLFPLCSCSLGYKNLVS